MNPHDNTGRILGRFELWPPFLTVFTLYVIGGVLYPTFSVGLVGLVRLVVSVVSVVSVGSVGSVGKTLVDWTSYTWLSYLGVPTKSMYNSMSVVLEPKFV